MLGGSSSSPSSSATALSLMQEGNATYLVSGNSGFTVLPDVVLAVRDGQAVKSQDVTFRAVNDFSSTSYQGRVESKLGSSSGSFKWWIILIIVAAVLVVLVLGFCIYRSGRQRKIDRLLGDN